MSHQSEPDARAVILNTRPDIKYVRAILNDGSEIVLSQRPLGNSGQPSYCTFFGELADGPFRIRLRLDWSQNAIDTNGDPTLDADVKKNGKKYRIERQKWHHTPKTVENGEWVYNFKFENIELRFKVGITSQRNQTAKSLVAAAPVPSADAVSAAQCLQAPWAFGERMSFCTACQARTTQTFLVDHNNEILATCHCGRQLKFPLTETEEQFDALLLAHHEANQGQIRM